MIHSPCWIFSILVLLMEESSTVCAENDSKYVCCGDFIQLFRNITINSTDMVVSLSIKASTYRLIAVWTSENATVSHGYKRKVFRDEYGAIWIRNVSSSDEAQYNLKVRRGSNVVTNTVDLGVLTAPNLNCKPKIKRIADVLVASLEAKECGNPPAYIDWLNYLGNHSEGIDSVMLPRENPAGTYYACIGGPALTCARTTKPSDYCTAFAIEGEHGSQETTTVSGRECTTSTCNLLILLSIFYIIVILSLTLLSLFVRKCTNGCSCSVSSEKTEKEKTSYSAVYTGIKSSGMHLKSSLND